VDVARWLNGMGITAFVLKYRLPDDAISSNKTYAPMQDAQRAIRYVRANAARWDLAPERIGIMGFSAGGHLAATASTRFAEKVYASDDTTSARPDFSILIYPVISMQDGVTHEGSRYNLLGAAPTVEQKRLFSNELQVTAATPPTFVIQSADDGAVPIQNSLLYAQALIQCKVPCELHIYPTGGHGYGLGRSDETESSWPASCRLWLLSRGLIRAE
jgi:acetyl esterase/lipase